MEKDGDDDPAERVRTDRTHCIRKPSAWRAKVLLEGLIAVDMRHTPRQARELGKKTYNLINPVSIHTRDQVSETCLERKTVRWTYEPVRMSQSRATIAQDSLSTCFVRERVLRWSSLLVCVNPEGHVSPHGRRVGLRRVVGFTAWRSSPPLAI